MQGSRIIEAGEKKAGWCIYFSKEVKENTQNGQGYWGEWEIDKRDEGNPWVDGSNKKTRMPQKEREQERDTVVRNTSC